MRYMLMVKATKDYEAGALPDETTLSEMARYTEELVAAGALLAAERLQPSSAGVRVHYAKGKITVTDGPFPETKELIAGFCLIQRNPAMKRSNGPNASRCRKARSRSARSSS